MRMKQPDRAKRLARMKKSPAVGLVIICIIGTAAMILAARQTSPMAGAAASKASGVTSGTVMASAYTSDGPGTGAPAAGAAAKAVKASAPVTITGCLEQDDETFRLKNTMGTNAPKARSWKSGFFKKGPATIEVVDSSHRLKLPAHVGRRVSVTGVLVNREMQVRSLQRVSASCNQKS